MSYSKSEHEISFLQKRKDEYLEAIEDAISGITPTNYSPPTIDGELKKLEKERQQIIQSLQKKQNELHKNRTR